MQRISESASLSIVFQQVHTFLEIGVHLVQHVPHVPQLDSFLHGTGYMCTSPDQDLHPITLCHTSLSSCVSIQMGMVTHYNVEYIIQETTCLRSTEAATADKCPHMECEFAVSPDKLYTGQMLILTCKGFFCMLKRSIVHAQFHSLHLLVFSNPTVFGLYSHRTL